MRFEIPFLKGRQRLAGLDIGSSSVKLMQLKKEKQAWRLLHLAIEELPQGAIVDGFVADSEAIVSAMQTMLKKPGGDDIKKVAFSLPGRSVIIKKVNMPLMSSDELSEVIEWEAEQHIPFPIADVNLDFEILKDNTAVKGEMSVILVAVKKEVVNDYISVINDSGLEPCVVDVNPFALENMFEMSYGSLPGENVAILNIGASVTDMSILSGGATAFTRYFSIAGDHYLQEIRNNFDLSIEDAERLKRGVSVDKVDSSTADVIISTVSDKLALDIKRSIDFFLGGGGQGGAALQKIYLGGGASRTRGLASTIEKRTSLQVEIIDPFNNILYDVKEYGNDALKENAPCFTVSLGLASRMIDDS